MAERVHLCEKCGEPLRERRDGFLVVADLLNEDGVEKIALVLLCPACAVSLALLRYEYIVPPLAGMYDIETAARRTIALADAEGDSRSAASLRWLLGALEQVAPQTRG